jgi:large subunit ribosomal protein L9
MEIILLEDVRNLGQRGEVVTVKPGYARNFLLPRGSALEANRANIAYFEQQRKKIDARHAREREAAMEIAGAIAGVKLSIAKRVGESETLYGSVTNAEIAEELLHKGIEVDRRRIIIGTGHGIKTLGDHVVTIELHPDVTAELQVSVVPEEEV